MIKRIFLLAATCMFASSMLTAQSPSMFSYQAVLRGNDGLPIVDQDIKVRISILEGSLTGDPVYSEVHSVSTGEFGIVTLTIGNGEDITGNFTGIRWGASDHFMKVEVDLTGTADYSKLGVFQLLSVPYALYADSAGHIPGVSFSDLEGLPTTLAGYGITDGATMQYIDNLFIITGDILRLIAGGFTVKQLLEGGRTVEELLEAGVPVSDIYSAGVTALELYNEGVLVGFLQQAGVPANELIEAGLQGSVTDIEGTSYRWVKIGTQIWMAENLKVKKYNNNTAITYPGTNTTAWITNTTGAYAWYNNDQATYGAAYGALYNWHAVNTGNLCPTGWHVPILAEYNQLITLLGGTSGAWTKLRETGNAHWLIGGGNDEAGFKAVPAGARLNTGIFLNIGMIDGLWTREQVSDAGIGIYLGGGGATTMIDTKTIGYSVRCVKD